MGHAKSRILSRLYPVALIESGFVRNTLHLFLRLA
jgi:hypothetical protein